MRSGRIVLFVHALLVGPDAIAPQGPVGDGGMGGVDGAILGENLLARGARP